MSPPISLNITILGSASPSPKPDNPCSGYLVRAGNTQLWVDAGTGTSAALQRHTTLDRLDAIWISHLHADHSADLLTAYYGALYSDVELRAPIPLYGPPGIADRLAHFLTNTPVRSPIEAAFAVHELYDGHCATLGGLTLRTRLVAHGMPAFALRAEFDGRSLAYSGDTAPCPNLTSLARDCDTLLCEADSAAGPIDETPVHHTPEDAGETAATANARQLRGLLLGSPTTAHLSTSSPTPPVMSTTVAQTPNTASPSATTSPLSIGFLPIPSLLGTSPASATPDPGDCTAKVSTVDMEQCYAARIENLDVKINQVQLAR